MNLEKLEKEFKNKKILILGMGKEGIDTFKFLRKMFPKKVLGIADRLKIKDLRFQIKDKKVKLHLGENYLKSLKNYDIIIKSPGIPIHFPSPPVSGRRGRRDLSLRPPERSEGEEETKSLRPPEIEKAQKEDKITSQTEIFFDNWPPERSEGWKMKANSEGGKLHRPGEIIGVTGTKGKGTTASLIYQILKKGGLRINLVGNIGKPALSQLFNARIDTIFVYELSSHQLYNLKKSPKIAVLLNIFPAHLEYFRNFREYINTKANITRYQTKDDYLIYNPKDKIVKEIVKKSKATKIPISTKLPVLRKTKSPLIGKFNLLNLASAVTVAKLFKISDKDIISAIRGFKPSAHRLEYVGTFKGIKFYNDSASTVPESTIGAIESLKGKLQTVILGGSECKVSFQKLAKEVLKSKIKTLILFPTTGRKIWDEVKKQAKKKSLPNHFFVSSMRESVKLAYSQTKRGGICLLSPASPSFSLFHDYKERGNLFKKYIKLYGKKREKSS